MTLATTEGMFANIDATTWTFSEDMTFEQWMEMGATFQQLEESLPWWLGAWLRYGERRYGEKYTQAIQLTGHKIERLKQYVWVYGAVPEHVRYTPKQLSWTHHRYVAKLSEDEQVYWLGQAYSNGWSSAELKQQLAGEKQTVIPSKLSKDATPEEAYDWLIETFDDAWWERFFDVMEQQ